MANNLMDMFRSFLGLNQEPPRNDFRNPIWGSDDDDDGDELYTRQRVNIHEDPMELHREITRQMQDMFRSFGSMFGDMSTLFSDGQMHSFPAITEVPSDTDDFNSNNIRDHYLKPGYHNRHHEHHPREDIDLDGKISSQEISGLLKQKEDGHKFDSHNNAGTVIPFNGNLVPGRSFCQTIITTSITKPDGTIETRKIIKNGNEVIEETTTTSPDQRGPYPSFTDPISQTGVIYSHVMSELSSLFRNFY